MSLFIKCDFSIQEGMILKLSSFKFSSYGVVVSKIKPAPKHGGFYLEFSDEPVPGVARNAERLRSALEDLIAGNVYGSLSAAELAMASAGGAGVDAIAATGGLFLAPSSLFTAAAHPATGATADSEPVAGISLGMSF